jgi:polysaccharide deacetylase 2 family uncharacterized protein YibQ
MKLPGLRTLGIFWAAVLLAVAGTAGMLAWLGPPTPPVVAEAPAAAPPPTPEPAPVPAVAPTPVSAPVAPRPAPPSAMPSAPEPPPLQAATARLSVAEPVIAAPEPALLEPSRHGPVPRIGADNRSSIRAYARAFDREDRRPRIGIVINNIGLFAAHSDDAIRRLPGGVTLAFSPYAARPEPLLERARARGMEILVALPLEPQGFGQQADPGDRALLTGLSIGENLDRLDWALSRVQGQVGAIGGLGGMRGERFAANAELLGTVQATLTRRGLLYVDPRPGAPQPARAFGRSVDVLLDEPSAVRAEVERRLAELEALARSNGSALGLANAPDPSVVAAIAAWSAGLEERGAVVTPITVLIRRPAEQASR